MAPRSAWRWRRPRPLKPKASRSKFWTSAACRRSTCTASWSRCARRSVRSWSTKLPCSAGSAPRSQPGLPMTGSTFWKRRLPGSGQWTPPIPHRATRSSICPTLIGFSRRPTWRWPMADQTFRLPDLGEGLTEAQLVAWRVEEGTQVDVNAPLCDVETAKAVVVIPSPWAGTIRKLHAQPGESVPVGAALVTIAAEGAPSAAEQRPVESGERSPGTLVGYGPGAGPEAGIRRRARIAPSAESADVRAAPFVRQLAKEKGLDLAQVTGSGPGGRITKADVEAAAGGAATAPAMSPSETGEQRISVVGIRKAIARQMVRSVSTIPQFTEFAVFDATKLMAAREKQKAV